MKNTNFFVVALLSILIAITSCKKSKNIPLGMTAIVNNTQWTATSYYATIDTANDTVINLYINGTNANSAYPSSDYFILLIHDYNYKAGVYNINLAIGPNCAYYTYGNVLYQSVSGVISLTQVSSSNVQGTFNCTFSSGSNLTVTNGQFNVPIQ